MDALTIAAIGMQNSLNRLNATSQNLANVMTPGYKKEIPVARTFGSYLGEVAVNPGTALDVAVVSHPPALYDHTPGTMRYTANPLDIAIDGPGFIEVATDTGPAYTRQGALHIDASGRLVTSQGLPVMAQGGELVISGTTATITPNGEVWQNERLVGQLKLARFDDPKSMVSLGGGLFAQGDAIFSSDRTTERFRIGYQENSNVNSTQEMVRLSETMRHFESMQKVIQGYDEMMGNAIRKLGEF